MTKVIYHAHCADGFCAAWILHGFLKGDAEFIPATYGDTPPEIGKKDRVWIVDFSYPKETLIAMAGVCASILVLDHHKTAQANLEGLPFCVFNMNESGGMMTWNHFHPDKPVPWLVSYTEDRDLWKWQLPNSREINAALSSYPQTFEVWNTLSNLNSSDFIAEGKAILRREKQVIEAHVKQAKEIDFDGSKILVVNATTLASEIGEALAKDRPFSLTWRYDGKTGGIACSLRSHAGGLDVSEIAKKYDGGGHRGAAGFRVNLLEEIYG